MSNTWFQFKQFKVNQDKCAMKVGSDSVLLGAWTQIRAGSSVVDLGSGTGILSLMMAQKGAKKVTAIESDYNAAIQTAENFNLSPWPEKFDSIFANAHDLTEDLSGEFQHAIFNPPYFSNGLKPIENQRSHARHLKDSRYTWLETAFKLTYSGGSTSFIIPTSELDLWLKDSERAGWHTQRKCLVKGNSNKEAVRVLVQLIKSSTTCEEGLLCIENSSRHDYTDEYRELTKEFYLNF